MYIGAEFNDFTENVSHLKTAFAFLTAEAGQHEEDKGEEAREGDGHNSQGRGPGQLTQRSAICRTETML